MPTLRERLRTLKQQIRAAGQLIDETERELGIPLDDSPGATASARRARGRPRTAAAGTTTPAAAAPAGTRAPTQMNNESIATLIAARPGITRDQILAEVKKSSPNVNAGTLGTRLSALTKQGRIRLEGAGYQPVTPEAQAA